MVKTTPKKKAKKIKRTPPSKTLSIQQELFCHFYVINDDLRGNATWSYGEAFNYKLDSLTNDDAIYDEDGKKVSPSTREKAINVCAVEASKLLRNPKIQARKVEMLNDLLKDDYVDSRLAYWIQSGEEPATSMAAIREYNKLKQRVKDPETQPSAITINIAPEIMEKMQL